MCWFALFAKVEDCRPWNTNLDRDGPDGAAIFSLYADGYLAGVRAEKGNELIWMEYCNFSDLGLE